MESLGNFTIRDMKGAITLWGQVLDISGPLRSFGFLLCFEEGREKRMSVNSFVMIRYDMI